MLQTAKRLLSFVIAICFAVACFEASHDHGQRGPCLQCIFAPAQRRKTLVEAKGLSVTQELAPAEIKPTVSAFVAPHGTVVAIVGPLPVLVLAQRAVFRPANRILGPPPPRSTPSEYENGATRAPPAA